MCKLDDTEKQIFELCSKSWESIKLKCGISKATGLVRDDSAFCEVIIFLAKKEFIEIRVLPDQIINPSTIDDCQSLLSNNVEIRKKS